MTNRLEYGMIYKVSHGALAQLGAHNTGSVGVRGSNPLCSTSRQCLHPNSNEVQCDARLYTTMVRFGFKSGFSTSGKLPLP